MRFIIPVNEIDLTVAQSQSQTCMVVDVGEVSQRVAKRKLRAVFKEWGVPNNRVRRLVREYFK